MSGTGGVVTPDDLTEASPGVFYASHPFVAFDGRVVELLKHAARNAPLRRARACAHPSPDAAQHDMLIVAQRETYIAPHRHPAKTESFLIVEGCCEALLFDGGGAVTEVIAMAPAGSGQAFFYRMPAMTYHALDIHSDCLVFVESAKGPFDPRQTECAPWAPAASDIAEGRRFIAAARAAFRSSARA